MQKNYKIHTIRNREWVKILPEVIKAINWETKKAPPIVTRKVDTPNLSICERKVFVPTRRIECGGKIQTTDPIWSDDVHKIDYFIITQCI